MPTTGTRFIVAGNFIDGSGDAVRRNIFLAVQNTVITAIGAAADLPRTAGGTIDDFSHCTIVPALVDCSVTLSRSPSVDPDMRLSTEAEMAAMVEQHIRYCHVHGVLAVADGDDTTGLIARYRGEMAHRSMIDIRSAGRLCRRREDCPTDPTAGGDFLKAACSGNIEDGDSSLPRLSREELHGILRDRGEKKAVVVANGPQQVAKALAAGCDAVEQGYGMGEENLREMAKKDVLWIPSVLRARNALDGASSGGDVSCRFSLRYVAPGKQVPGAEAFWKKTLAEQLVQLALARKLGVATAVGTGAGSAGLLHGESVVEEMKLFIKAGYSLEETICCASENGARFFGMERLGRLAVGRQATFLISRGTVKQLPRKLSYLEGVYINGAPSPWYRKNPVRSA
jgi:imidazolonepropionase-like amidohydrolase